MKTSIAEKAPKKTTSEKGEGQSALHEFFVGEIKDIYWAENHISKALPKMSKAATSQDLAKAFNTHLEQTKGHIERLEKVFQLLDQKPVAKKCEAMAGILEEGNSIIEETDKGTSTRDVGLILAAQKVEHYEISTYGGLAALAKTLGLGDVADILSETLNEEKSTDKLLSDLSDNINPDAAQE